MAATRTTACIAPTWIAAETPRHARAHVVPGVTTAELDDLIRTTIAGGAAPATLGYRGYTHSSCISINHVVCHGIPSDRQVGTATSSSTGRRCSTAGMATPAGCT